MIPHPDKERRPGERRSLTVKQAMLTLPLVLLLSVLAGAIELALDTRLMRQEIVQQTDYRLDLVLGTSAEAAFQLNPDLASQVVEGLYGGGRTARVIMRDDFGRTMASRSLPWEPATGRLADLLFGDILHYQRTLYYGTEDDGAPQPVGELHMTLAISALYHDFLSHSRFVFTLGVLKALVIAVLVVALFHGFITRPLLRVHAAIVATDPRRPGQWPKPRLRHHSNDELGDLVHSLDELLVAFQSGLDQRDRLRHISTMDGLTGIANRRRFDDFLEAEWQRAMRSGSALSIIFIDIDHFKEYNDHYGHLAGDDTLRSVADVLTGVVHRAADLVARYGGEEFVCVLPDTDLQGALQVAEQIRHGISELNIPHAYAAGGDRITASLGVASATPADGLNCAELLAQADAQLYQAKHQGRDRVVAHS